MKTIDSIAFASSAACFAILIQVGPESSFWENHYRTGLLLAAGISTGVLSAFLRQTKLFEKPGTIGNRVFCALGILVALAGIGGYMHAFKGGVAKGFFGGAALLAVMVIDFAVRDKFGTSPSDSHRDGNEKKGPYPCAAANPTIALWLQSWRLAGRVVELLSLARQPYATCYRNWRLVLPFEKPRRAGSVVSAAPGNRSRARGL